MLSKKILKIKDFIIRQKVLIGSLVFFSIFSLSLITFATPPTNKYAPGATLDPACAPSSTNCSVSVATGVSDFNTIDYSESPYTVISSDQVIYADSTNGDVEINLPEIASTFKRDIYVVKTSASNSVFVNAYASDYINETTAIQLSDNRQSLTVESVSTHQWLGTLNFVEYAVSPLAVEAATTAALTTSTYANGTAGVGATITDNAPYAVLGNINTVAVAVNDRVLVKNQSTTTENGVYVVTSLGVAGSSPWILTRATDSDETAEFDPQVVIPAKGNTTNKGKNFAQTTTNPTIGTDAIVYSLITQAPGTGNVTQKTSGTQATGQIPFWTSTARELDKGSSAFTFGTVAANSLNITGSYYVGSSFFGTQDASNVRLGTSAGSSITSGTYNTFLGIKSGKTVSTNLANTFVGYSAGENSTGNTNTFLGYSAGKANTGASSVYVGSSSAILLASGGGNTFIGSGTGSSLTSGSDNIIIGSSSVTSDATSMAGSILIGSTIHVAPASLTDSIALGFGSELTADNQFILGNAAHPIYDAYLGNGVVGTSGVAVPDFTLHSTGGNGTNVVGGDLNIAGGISTGSGAGGSIVFQTSSSGASSSTPNSLADVVEIDGEGRVFMYYLTSATGDNAVCINAGTTEITNSGGSTCTVSSLRFKHNITDLDSGLATVLALRPISYEYNTRPGVRLGLIAEEVKEVEPRLVFYEQDEITVRGVNYEDLTAILVKSVQELNIKVDGIDSNTSSGISLDDVKNFFASVEEKIIGGLTKMKDLVVETLKIGSPDARTGITFYDETNGSPYCVSIIAGAVATVAGECVVIVPPPIPEDNGGGNGNGGGQNNTDTTPPVITLIGDTTITLTIGDTYIESGATAVDDTDGDITGNIVITGTVDTSIEGSYTVTYNVVDIAGNNAVEATRTIIVTGVTPPPNDPPPQDPPPNDPPPQE